MAQISVIIPVYNVEHYLRECLDSVINQSFKDLEIIIVNDGSTDKSYELCQRYADLDKRIKLLSKANGGLSSARNLGLDYVTAPYIMFVDSDDFIRTDMCEIMYRYIKLYNAGMVSCGYYEYHSGKDLIEHKITDTVCRYNLSAPEVRRNFAERLITHHQYNINVWLKIYRADIFKDLRFPLVKYEDLCIFCSVLNKAQTVVYIPDMLYYYRKDRKDSIMYQYENSPQNMIDLEHIDAWILFCVEYKQFAPDNPWADKLKYRVQKNNLDKLLAYGDKTQYYDCIRVLRRRLRGMLKSKNLPLSKKLSIIGRLIPGVDRLYQSR